MDYSQLVQDAYERAATRQTRAVRPRGLTSSGRQEGPATKAIEAFDPTHPDPLSVSLGLASLLPFGKAAKVGTVAGGALLSMIDPAEAGPMAKLMHAISAVKLPRPISEMSATLRPSSLPTSSVPITPAQMQGGYLLPAIGDRSRAGQVLTGVGDFKLDQPVEMMGGHGYMSAHSPRGAIWESAPSIVSRLQNEATRLSAEGKPVFLPYTATSPLSIDFSHHMTDTLSDLVQQSPVSRNAAKTFNDAMRERVSKELPSGVPDFPGVMSPRLPDYLRSAPGAVRNRFAEIMDTRGMQNLGFPSVAEARVAVTDPQLLDVPWGASGLSISRFTPGAARPPAMHTTEYGAALPGQYAGTFGTSVPPEIMYPDRWNELLKRMPGEPLSRIAYTFNRQLPAQETNQRWVDTLSGYLQQRRQQGPQ